MDELIEKNCECTDDVCTSVSTQYADVTLPVKVKPYAILGEVETDCCGDPTITIHQGVANSCSVGCEIVITQCIAVKIPIEYGTVAEAGNVQVNCRRTNCAGCK